MFRVGTTSYILPDDILPNVEFLAPQVDDVELVLFETDEHGSNLPDARLRRRLADLAAENGLSYTVHLPLDVRPGAAGGDDCLVKAARVIDATLELGPYAYVVHLDGRAFSDRDGASPPAEAELSVWREGAARSLERICGWIGDPRLLCVENVEAWDPELFAPVLESVPCSRTADVGHLWLRGLEPLGILTRWMARSRVVHLHGIGERDHASLARVPEPDLDAVVALLLERFQGVVTLEVFSEADFRSSLSALRGALERVGPGGIRG